METRKHKFNGLFKDIDGERVEGIDCEINNPRYGWLPCSIWPDEYPEEYAGAVENATAFVPPTRAEIVAAKRSNHSAPLDEVLAGMVDAGWITETEAAAWLTRTALPESVEGEISGRGNVKSRLRARAAFFRDTVSRSCPCWNDLFRAMRKPEDQVDDVFGLKL